MFDYLKENPIIKLLLNLILGIILFKVLFGLVFGGASTGTFQGLIVLVLQLVKVVLVLGLVAGSMVLTSKLLSGKELSKLDFTPEQIIKGVVIGILGLAAFYLLSGTLGGTTGGYYAFNIGGFFTSLLTLIMNLFSIALVVFLALGAFQAARPYLEKEFQSLFTANQTTAQQPVTSVDAGNVEVAPQQKTRNKTDEAPH